MNLRRVGRERGRGEEGGRGGRGKGRKGGDEEGEGRRGGGREDRREERIRGGKRDEKRGLGCKHFGHARYHKISELNKTF